MAAVYTQVTPKFRRFGHKKDLVNRSFRGRNNEKQGFLAGVAGFEPTNDGVRARIFIKKTPKTPHFKHF